jgi:hypothetical protein
MTEYKEIIENTFAKHAFKGQLIRTHLFPGDTGGSLYRMTDLQDVPYKVRVMDLFWEKDAGKSSGLKPQAHYLDENLPCTIYVEN